MVLPSERLSLNSLISFTKPFPSFFLSLKTKKTRRKTATGLAVGVCDGVCMRGARVPLPAHLLPLTCAVRPSGGSCLSVLSVHVQTSRVCPLMCPSCARWCSRCRVASVGLARVKRLLGSLRWAQNVPWGRLTATPSPFFKRKQMRNFPLLLESRVLILS